MARPGVMMHPGSLSRPRRSGRCRLPAGPARRPSRLGVRRRCRRRAVAGVVEGVAVDPGGVASSRVMAFEGTVHSRLRIEVKQEVLK